jgi:transcriptional regulator with XRE-family HTH domain
VKNEEEGKSIFSKNLKRLLRERGISQKAVADLLGLNPSVVHDWLNGGTPRDPAVLLKLCRTLKIDFQWLMTGEAKEFNPSELGLGQIFDVEPDSAFSGMFLIEAKRLKLKKKKGDEK